MIIILRKSANYDSWYPLDDYTKKSSLEKLLKKYIDEEGYRLVGMNELKIVLFKPDNDNPSVR